MPIAMEEADISQSREVQRNGRHSVPPGRWGPENNQQQGRRPAIPPPTAPKPKTPVPFLHDDSAQEIPPTYTNSSQNTSSTVPVRRNASVANLLEQQQLQYKNQFVQQQPTVGHHTTLGRYDRQYNPKENKVTNLSTDNTFLEAGLPAPISREGMAGRRPSDSRSMTLPARTRNSNDCGSNALPLRMTETEGTPLSRRSKNGLPQDPMSLEVTPAPVFAPPPPAFEAANVSTLLPTETMSVRQGNTGSQTTAQPPCRLLIFCKKVLVKGTLTGTLSVFDFHFPVLGHLVWLNNGI